jgi:glycosyltransferase involved in cell wall biosynthesis
LGWEQDIFHVVFSTPRLGDANKRPALAREVIECLNSGGLHSELHIMLDIPHNEMPTRLNAADAVLMTSAHEGSPNIIKEALACDRPVVSVDVGDVRERLEGVEGCFIAEPDLEALAGKLQAVADGPGIVPGREKVKDLSIEAVARRLVVVYEAAIASRETG